MLRLGLVTIAAAFLASAASAEEDLVAMSFRYDASELASPESAEALYARMNLRARRMCDPRDDYLKSARDECAADLVNQWVEAINDPRLDAIRRREA